MFAPNLLAQADPEVWNAVHLEHRRQDDHVELIASENYVSPAVLIAHGGHLTHGSTVNYSGKLYKVISYGLGENEEIDYAQAERLAMEHRPRLIVTCASAYAPAIDWKRFRAIADKAGALLMADMAHYAGRIAAGLYPSPIGIADFVTTTTHKTLRGPRGGLIFGAPEREKAVNAA